MWSGTVHSIYIAPAAKESMVALDEVRAVPGKGLEGDRYLKGTGTWSDKRWPDREITLVEIETIKALSGEAKIEIEPGNARRNIVTEGVPLNHLVGQEFRVGEVRLRGIRLCEPCGHLERLTQEGVKAALIHRGGLRAEILAEGIIRTGDTVTLE